MKQYTKLQKLINTVRPSSRFGFLRGVTLENVPVKASKELLKE